MDAEYAKKRLEKDLFELKRMIDDHFKQRQEDEAELAALQDRIEKRKAVGNDFYRFRISKSFNDFKPISQMRAEQMAARIERERIQAEAAEAARVAKAAEEGKIDKSMELMILALLKSFKMRSDCCDDKL